MPDDKWICQGCTAVNYPDSIYCSRCGNTLAQVVVVKKPDPPPPNIFKRIVFGIIIILIFVGIFYVNKYNLIRMPEEYPGTSIEEQRIIELAGSKPASNPRDGKVFCVSDYMKAQPCAPDCRILSGWTTPTLTNRNGTIYWAVHVFVETLDDDGDYIQSRKIFFIQHNKVHFME